MYQPQDSNRLADLLGYEADELTFDEQIIDLSSILTTTFLNVFASQIDNQMSYSAPRLLSANLGTVSKHLTTTVF